MRVRWFLLLLCAVSGLAACGTPSPAQPSNQSTASVAPVQTPSQATSPPSGSSAAGAQWDSILSAARQEADVSFAGPPIPDLQSAMGAFTEKYGIQVDYIGALAAQHYARISGERGAGLYTTDVVMNGPSTLIYSFYPNGMLDPIKPIIFLPEDQCGNWTTEDGCPWFVDPAGEYIARLENNVPAFVWVNSQSPAAETVRTSQDLLNPNLKGSIVAQDPSTQGPGREAVRYLLEKFGPEYVAQLYQGQDAIPMTDDRQIADGVAHGKYSLAIGNAGAAMLPLLNSGLPVAPVRLDDAPGYEAGAFGSIALMNRAPHPNAAIVLINWLLGPEGATAVGKADASNIARTDLPNDWIPSFEIPQTGETYVDHQTADYLINVEPGLDDQINAIFPR